MWDTASFESCTFDSNSANKNGGAIFSDRWSRAVTFETTCPQDEFASGTGELASGYNLYDLKDNRPFSADLIDGDNCRPCPSGLVKMGAGCDYPASTFGVGFLPCSRFWYYDPWNSTCGAFRIMSIIFLFGFGLLSVYIHARLFQILRGDTSDGAANHGWKKYKLNAIVFFAQLDLAGDTLYLSYEAFGTPLLELIGLLVYLLPTAVFMISQRELVNRHLCVVLRPSLRFLFFKYETWDEFYKLALGSLGRLIWFITFSWLIVPVVFVYYLVLFVFVSSKLMCVVTVAESFINFGLEEDKKQKMTPAMANRMFNGSVFTELTIDTIPQLAISIINAAILKTTNMLFFFQVLTSSLLILNEVYPFIHGTIKHRSLVKALEKRDHKLLEVQSRFLSNGTIKRDDMGVGRVCPESSDETQIQMRDVTPISRFDPSDDIVAVVAVRKLQREVSELHREVEELQISNDSVVNDLRSLRSDIEPLLFGHDD